MNNNKELYTKSEIIQKLGVQAYILSLWEKEFALATISAADGTTLYTSQGYAHLKKIKELIYEKGYSLEAAKKTIAENKEEMPPPFIAASPLNFESQFEPKKESAQKIDPSLMQELKNLQKQLLKLKKLLA